MIPEKIFRKFVLILEQSQGSILRQFSNAVVDIVDSIFRGTLHRSGTFAIEDIERTQILEQPKGSPRLLELLSQTRTSPLPNACP